MNNSNIEKEMTQGLKVYQTPCIEMIHLDNEIALVLASDPPIGPGETKNNVAPDYFNNDPYRNNG